MAAGPRRWVLALLLFGPVTAGAQEPVRWKLQPGQSFDIERIARHDQVVELKDKSFRQKSVSTWLVHFEVLRQETAGYRLAATLTRVEHKVTGTVPAGAVNGGLAEKMRGARFTLAITPAGGLRELGGYEDFLAKAGDKQAARVKALRVTMPEPWLRAAFADMLGRLPERAPAAGATWEQRLVEPIPHFGAFRSTWRFTRAEPVRAGQVILYTVTTKYEPPAAGDPALFRVVKGELRGEEGRGKIVFDATAGRLVSHDRSMRVRGSLTVEAAGRAVPLEFRSDDELRLRLVPAR